MSDHRPREQHILEFGSSPDVVGDQIPARRLIRRVANNPDVCDPAAQVSRHHVARMVLIRIVRDG